MKTPYWLIAFTIIFVLPNFISAQEIQSPAEFLGYELGTKFTPHHRVVAYFKHLEEASEYLQLEQYGETYEGRELLLATLSKPENLANIEAVKENNLKRTGLVEGNASTGPPIIWLSYNVHGNESVSTEASMATAHALLTQKAPVEASWLEDAVVLIDPCLNPDGRDRYVNWYNQMQNAIYDPHPDASEHREPWPGGRPNHYLFDLNRDWAWATQKETQQRLKVYNSWMPHIHVDFHEQAVDNPYYFAPAAEPFHEVISDWQREFQNTIGKNHLKYFDKEGWLYFTKERFDLFYPSYGDTYPTYNGAIGMTYEQGGSGRAGLGVLTQEGDTLTLKDRIAHHYTTGISTVEISIENKERLVAEFQKFFQNPGKKATYQAYIVKGKDKPEQIKKLKSFLALHEIQYASADGTPSLNAYNYVSREKSKTQLAAEDIVVLAQQPKQQLIKVLFEPQAVLSDSITYDITGWGIPYMFGLEAYASESAVKVKNPQAVEFSSVEADNEAYGYVAPWESLNNAKYLSALLKAEVKVRYATEPFTLEGNEYKRGALIITRRNNENLGQRFDDKVVSLANAMEIPLKAVKSGYVDAGKDFGSGTVRYIKAPKVALLGGEQTSSLAFGEIWHYFEQQLDYPVTILRTDYFNSVDMSRYDVLILPNGYYSMFDEEKLKDLQQWVRAGGRLIVMGNALNSFVDKDGFGLKTYASDESKEAMEEKEESYQKEQRLRRYEDSERSSISDYISGSIYSLKLDNSHPLAYGYGDTYFTLKSGSSRFSYLDEGWNVAVLEDATQPLSGFAGFRAKEKLNETLVFGTEPMGRGEIIYMVDNPLFRAFWENGKLLFANAVFMVGQ